MSVNLKQNSDGSMDLDGQDHNDGGFVNARFTYTATSVDTPVFVATRAYVVKSILGRVEVAGTDGSAVTLVMRKAASGTAGTAGTALHSGTFNLKGTAATNQALTLSTTAADLLIPAGTAIFVDYTGTLTSAVGVINVCLAPA